MSDPFPPHETPPESGDIEGPGLLERALRSAGSDALRYVPVRFIPALVSLVSVPLFTSVIPPADYGAYYLLSSVAILGSNVSIGWLSSSAVRFYWPLRKEGQVSEYLATIVWSALAALVSTAIGAGAVAWLARAHLSDTVLKLLPIALVYFVVNFLTDLLAQILRAAKQSSAFARVQIVGAILSTVLSVVLVWWGHAGAAGLFAGGALGWLLLAPWMFRSLSGLGSLAPSHISRPLIAQFAAYGLPMIPVGVSSWALILIDRFVIQSFNGSAEVGLYSVAYSLGEKLVQLVTVPLLLTMTPSLVEVYESQGQRLAEKVQTQFVRYFALVTAPILFGLAASAGTIMHVFTGSDYWSAAPVLPIVAAGAAFSSFSQIATAGLALHKRTNLIMANALTAAAFNLVANVALVPVFGYMAAAYNTVAAYVVMMALSWWQSHRYMTLRLPWGDLLRVLVSASVMALAVVWLPGLIGVDASRVRALAALAAQGVAGAAIYLGVLVAVKGVKPSELSAVRSLLGRIVSRG